MIYMKILEIDLYHLSYINSCININNYININNINNSNVGTNFKTKKICNYLNRFHLSDNFGYALKGQIYSQIVQT